MKFQRFFFVRDAAIVVMAFGLATGLGEKAQGQFLYNTAGSTYSQNFDSLPNTPQNTSLGTTALAQGWIDDTASPGTGQFSIVGWYLYHPTSQSEGGINGHQRLRIGAGTATTGAFMSWGSSGSTDRALGDLGSATIQATDGGDVFMGLRLRNTTGQTLGSFTLTYNGEQWRDGGAATPAAESMTFGYSTSATSLIAGTYTSVGALSWSTPVNANTGSGAAVDGNAAGKVTGITATVTDLNWADGTDLWLRWDDLQRVGNDDGLGIDDLTFSAVVVPEPATWALLATGALGLGLYRRKRR